MPLDDLEGRYFRPAGKDGAAFSRASTFTPLIDGNAYFGAIRAAVEPLTVGDACYIAGWSLSDGFKFQDGVDSGICWR